MSQPFTGQLEIVQVRPQLESALATFFKQLVASETALRFHPHPFTAEEARQRAHFTGQDVYCVGTVGNKVLCYGMLRGWDEGYAVPSLGIVVGDESQGLGLGRLMMNFLHTEARRRGTCRIRLKVYPDNIRAIELYRSLGYIYQTGLEDGQLVGFKDLGYQHQTSGTTDLGMSQKL